MRTPVNQINNPGPRDRIRWLAAVVYGWNDLAVENNQMPRFGIGQVVTAITRGGQSVFGIARPRSGKYTVSTSDYKVTYDATTGLSLDLTAPTAFVAAGNIGFTEGQGGTVTQDWPALVFCDESTTAGGSVVIGSTVGPIAGSWYVGKNGSGFRVVGIDTSLTAPTGYKAVWISPVYSSSINSCEYRISYGKEESYTESGVSRYRWHESYDNSYSGEYCGIYDDHGYGTNTLQSSTIGAGSWFWTYVFGDPSTVGIVQDETVTGSDIFDTGTLDVTQGGFYEFELDISWNLGGVSGNTGTNQRIPFVTTSSGGSPSHTHSDSTPDTTGVNSIFGGVYMFREGDTAINATYQYYSDEFTKPRRVFHNINCAETHVFAEGSIKNHVWKFRANLDSGDRIAFRPYATYLAVYQKRKSQLQVQCQSMIITRLKDSETGTDLTA